MARGKNLKLSGHMVLFRAASLEGTGNYSLEEGKNGGADPAAALPYYENHEGGTADCVGVGAWIQGFDRYQPHIKYYGGWVNTNSVFHMPELFRNLGQDFSAVRPGDILVYPSYKPLIGKRKYGHWMTVMSATYKGKQATKLSQVEVIHCSQRGFPATRRTWGFAKGPSKAWAFFRPVWR